MIRREIELKLKERYARYYPKQKYILRYGVTLHNTTTYKVQGEKDGAYYTFLPHEIEKSVLDIFKRKENAKKIVQAIKQALRYYGVEQDRNIRRLAVKLARDVQSVYTEG